jgi:uncharacterized protein YecE (DUF72 family)
MKKLWIGTSGYSYKHWRNGVFYPVDLPEKKWLEYYMTQFPTVELNVTFYRLPAQAVFKSWYKRADKNFRFFVKGSRYITHLKRLKEPAESLRIFFKTIAPLKEKNAGILWQLPPQFKADVKRLEIFLKALRKKTDLPNVMEFRDASWFHDDVTSLFEKYDIAYCRADGRVFYQGMNIPDTSSLVYIRRHGPKETALYRHSYPEETIQRDAEEINSWLKKNKTVYVYYNNDIGGAAPRDAKKLEEFVSHHEVRKAA